LHWEKTTSRIKNEGQKKKKEKLVTGGRRTIEREALGSLDATSRSRET